MVQPGANDVSVWRRALAYWWYVWGLSLCYSGTRGADRTLYAAGVRAFERARQAWPAFAGASYRCGLIRGRELGQHAQALEDLSRAIDIEPSWPEPFLQRGLFKRFDGDSAGAINDLEHYIQLTNGGYWRDEAQRQIDQIHAERGSE